MANDEKRLELAEKVAARMRGSQEKATSKRPEPIINAAPPKEAGPQVAAVEPGQHTNSAESATPKVVQPAKPTPSPTPVTSERQDGPERTRGKEHKRRGVDPERPVIELNQGHLYREGMVVPDGVTNRLAEEFRLIKRPLLLKAFPRDGVREGNSHVMMVTSARPGEGKTFTAINLALSIASEPDLNVLLIDTDTYNNDMERLLGIDEGTGLLDVLADDSMSIADVMLRTSIPNLSVVQCGSARSLETELLASQRMAELVEDIAHRYPDRVIIFDTVPALASSVAGVLALHVGQVVVVVEAERTQRQAVEETVAQVSRCKNVSLLLNKCRYQDSAGIGYYEYYGRGGKGKN